MSLHQAQEEIGADAHPAQKDDIQAAGLGAVATEGDSADWASPGNCSLKQSKMGLVTTENRRSQFSMADWRAELKATSAG
ncbi:hypothetical protein TYRP_015800 [Tyrophagus putrescentiae]|nr:hypothetical protein TYRP_015800 [Tyrophagus putrescentiae]